jgi:hypothetical protein
MVVALGSRIPAALGGGTIGCEEVSVITETVTSTLWHKGGAEQWQDKGQ